MAKGLNREVLARAALAIVDADGLAALSMRRLARELGVDPMAAYKHVPNKEALLDAVVDAVLAEVDLTGLSGDWRERLRGGVRRVLAAMTAHPQAAPLLSARKWSTPAGLPIVEWGLGEMIGAGVDAHRAVVAMNATGLYLTALAQAIAGADTSPALGPDALDPAAFPVTLGVLAAGHGLRDYTELLEFWLDTVVDAVEPGAAGSADAARREGRAEPVPG